MPIHNEVGYLPHEGAPRVLTILAAFQDSTFTINKPVEAFSQYLNNDLQADLGNKNHYNISGVKNYFSICSQGQFTPQFDIVGPVTLPHELAYYGDSGTGLDDRFTEFCSDAVALAKDSVSDWSVYDNDGDGNVELVCIIYAGYGQNQGGGTETIWPRASLQNLRIDDSCSINFFNCSPELFFPGSSVDAEGIAMKDYINGTGVFIHEMSHCLGLPDLYQTNGDYQNNQGMESWDIMDYGCYNRNGFAPATYTAWEQEVMGWNGMVTITNAMHISNLLPLVEGGKAYKIPNVADDNEYMAIECVMQRGLNRYAYASGLLVYHVAYPSSQVDMVDAPNNTPGHPGVAVVPASGLLINNNLCGFGEDYTKDQWRASMQSSVFPGTGHVNCLTSEMQLPNYWFYDEQQDTVAVGYSLDNITDSGDGVSFDITTLHADGIQAVVMTDYFGKTNYYDLLGRIYKGNDLRNGQLYILNRHKRKFVQSQGQVFD